MISLKIAKKKDISLDQRILVLQKNVYYKNDIISVPCPVSGYECGNSSEIFDRYDEDIKLFMLTQGNKENKVEAVD